jgi:hypothetical protein
MKTLLIALLTALSIGIAKAEAIASMPNEGNGKIVLTNQVCEHKGKTYSPLKRAYSYSAQGYTFEGCFHLEDDTVVIIWGIGERVEKRRYPASGFTLINRGQPV